MAHDVELVDRLRAVLAGERGVVEERMLGGLAFLLDGHMVVSASGRGGLLRVDPAEAEELTVDPRASRAAVGGARAGRLAADRRRRGRCRRRAPPLGRPRCRPRPVAAAEATGGPSLVATRMLTTRRRVPSRWPGPP